MPPNRYRTASGERIGTGMKTPVRSHAEFLSRICDQFLIIFACMAAPALAASLWRIVDIGWQPVMAVHVALATGAWLIAAFRARIPYRVRAGFIVLSFVIVALGGLWSFGLAAGGRWRCLAGYPARSGDGVFWHSLGPFPICPRLTVCCDDRDPVCF